MCHAIKSRHCGAVGSGQWTHDTSSCANPPRRYLAGAVLIVKEHRGVKSDLSFPVRHKRKHCISRNVLARAPQVCWFRQKGSKSEHTRRQKGSKSVQYLLRSDKKVPNQCKTYYVQTKKYRIGVQTLGAGRAAVVKSAGREQERSSAAHSSKLS